MDNNTVYSYIKDIAQRLKNPRKYGDVSIMVGAGFSKNAQSKGIDGVEPPNWSELAKRMYDELYPEPIKEKDKEKWRIQRIIKTSGKNVTKLAEEYIANFDRNKINNLIEQSIEDEKFVPGELHKKLLKLRWSDVFTTNYDTLLEQTVDLIYRENSYEIIYSQNDLPGSIKPRIVKLHGSIPQVKPYIICDEDYRTYPSKYPALVNTVQQAMLETRLCLIGFSGDDPNFQNWLGWLRDNMGEYSPKIYLIDFFDEMNDSEKRLLENKGIVLVDLSLLVSKNNNKYYEAISKFLDLLKEEQKDDDIYIVRPYQNLDDIDNIGNQNEYVKKMYEYSCKIINLINPYILLPEIERKKYEEYFSRHFMIILKLEMDKIKPELILNVIRILRKCQVVLTDNNAECLENIKNVLMEQKGQEVVLCEIILYLLEMYRIDGKREEYQKCMEQLEKVSLNFTYYSNEFVIEKIKYLIMDFDYENAENIIDKMKADTLEYKIKKAGFYKQLLKTEKADTILKECSAELAQMKLSDEIYASYLGYLNLCYRMGHYTIDDEYSDANYFNNPYNTRQIVVKQREEMQQKFYEQNRKNEENDVLPFSLNQNKPIIRVIIGSNEVYKSAFSFIIGLDRLCLPLFFDQIKLLPRVIDEIIESSKSMYWKISLIIRTNDEKTINQILTRKIFIKIKDKDKRRLFDELIELASLYTTEDTFIYKKYFVSMKNIVRVLACLSVSMEDKYIIKLLTELNRFSYSDDVFVENKINKVLRIISTRFNKNIANNIQNIIFKEFSAKYHLASYFNDIPIDISVENQKIFYIAAISELKSNNNKEKENAIAKLLLLWSNNPLLEYEEKISKLLWPTDKLLDINLYYPFVLEQLPHPSNIKFSKLYYKYLMETEYEKSVVQKGVHSINNSYNNVYQYLSFFYATSKMSSRNCEKIILDAPLANKILDRSYEFILNEKELLDSRYDFMGEKDSCKQKFVCICNLTALIYIEAIKNQIISVLLPRINKIIDELKSCNISTIVLDMVEMIRLKNYEKCVDTFENTILANNKEYYPEAFVGAECLVFLMSEDTDLCELISFKRFFNAIAYLHIECGKTVWIQLAPLLRHSFFGRDREQKYISESVERCINKYGKQAEEGERYYLDGLYNCANTLHEYYKSIQNRGIDITDELEKCVARAKEIENYEIHNIWND